MILPAASTISIFTVYSERDKKMRERKKSGLVIEMMLIFMLITFGFCLLITTVVIGLNGERKYAKTNIQMQTDLNQIGEYYIRYIEEGGDKFPSGNDDFSQESFAWMDDLAKEFFTTCSESYKFTFKAEFSISRSGLTGFFKTKYIWRKLTVIDSNNQVKMIVELKEKWLDENMSTYEIYKWDIGDSVKDDPDAAGSYQPDDLNLLQKLWKFLGMEIKDLRLWNPSGDLRDILDFFNMLDSNWRESMSDIK